VLSVIGMCIADIYPLSLHDALPIYGTAPKRLRGLNLLGATLILGSGICFVYALVCGNDFWIDEAMVVQAVFTRDFVGIASAPLRSEEHTSELQSRENIVCRLLLEKK